MPKKLLTIVAFLTVLFIGDRFGAFVLGTILKYSKLPVVQMYAGRSESDVVLLGNSRAFRHFDVDFLVQEFGGPVENLSYPGVSMLISLALLRDFIDIYGAPELVVLELSGLTSKQSSAAVFRPLTPRSDRLTAILKSNFPRQYYATKISHLYNYNNNFFLNASHKVFFPVRDPVLQGAMSEVAANDPKSRREENYFITRPGNMEALKAIIDLTQKQEIELRLVISPSLLAFARQNGYHGWRQEILTATKGIRIWDYGIRPPLELKYFRNGAHLNVRGVDHFMDLLRREGFFKKQYRRSLT